MICPNYFDEICVLLETNGVHTRSPYQKLNDPCRYANFGQKALSYVTPIFWNHLNKTLKISTSLNAFKHSIRQHYFNELKEKES